MVLVYSGLLLLFLLQIPNQRFSKKNMKLCAAGAFLLFAVSAMKEITAYGDLINYANAYKDLPFYRYTDLFLLWKNGDMKDVAFYAVAKPFADIGARPEIWMGFIALVYAAAVGFFVYHHSKQPFMSFLVLVVLFYGFTLSGLRQAMAMSLCFVAYHFAVKRKFWPFLALVLMAFLLHSSALIFLPTYWVMGWRLGWKHVVMVVAAGGIAMLFPEVFRRMIELIAWNDYLLDYADRTQALSWAGYAIQLFVLIFCVVFRIGCAENNEARKCNIDVFINCMVIGICLQSFTVVVAEAFRMSYYYSMCSVAAIPNVIADQKIAMTKNWLYLAVGVCLVAYMAWSGQYNVLTFFWQK